MATIQQIIDQAYTKVNGESEAQVQGSDDWNTYLNVLSRVVQQWAETPYVKWQSLFNMNYTLPDKVADGQLIYPVAEADSIHVGNTPYDGVYFVDDSGELVAKYTMTNQALFDSSSRSDICVLVSDGLHLKSVPSNIVGTSIRLPVYVDPPSYANASGSTVVKIDSVSWLIAEMSGSICDASPVPFIARNADKFHKEALVFMKTMRANNNRAQHLFYKGAASSNNSSSDNLIGLIKANAIVVGGGTSGDGGNIDGGSA